MTERDKKGWLAVVFWLALPWVAGYTVNLLF